MIKKEEYEEAQQIVWDYEDQIKKVKKGVEYHGCEFCGHTTFVKMYNVYNIEVKLGSNGEEVIGVEKDHLLGHHCQKCRKYNEI